MTEEFLAILLFGGIFLTGLGFLFVMTGISLWAIPLLTGILMVVLHFVLGFG